MSPSLPAGGFTCADGQAVRGGARASAGRRSSRKRSIYGHVRATIREGYLLSYCS